MKNKYIITGIVLIIFLGLNYNSFINFYYNAFGTYEKTSNSVGKYNIGTSSYIDSNYENSINSFSGILDENNKELNFRVLHNLANTYFKFGEEKSLDIKIESFTKSVENYRGSLNIKFDEETQKNLEFVLEKLRIAKLEQEKEKQEEQEEQGKENENKDNGDNKKEEDENESGEENNSEESNKTDEYLENKEGGDSESGESSDLKLSEETKKILEQKEEELQKLQEEIGQYYNKNYKEKVDPFSNFDQFFDNSLLDDTEEKDW